MGEASTLGQRAAGVTSEVVDGQAVLVAASGKEFITLNPVGTLIWGALDTARDSSSPDELSSRRRRRAVTSTGRFSCPP